MKHVYNELSNKLYKINKNFKDIEYGYIYVLGYRENDVVPRRYFYKNKNIESIPVDLAYQHDLPKLEILEGLILFTDHTWLERVYTQQGYEFWEYKQPVSKVQIKNRISMLRV